MASVFKLLAAAALVAAATPAAAVDFSFTGTFDDARTVQLFSFSVDSLSTVTLQTWSYAGGTNADGTIIPAGGFDPILSVFALPTGTLVAFNDDGSSTTDPVTGSAYDSFLELGLSAGNYVAAISLFPNFPRAFYGGTSVLADGFSFGTQTPSFNGRNRNWAFDIVNVSDATLGNTSISTVPEPASWAMLIAGFGLTGAVMRRRRSAVAA